MMMMMMMMMVVIIKAKFRTLSTQMSSYHYCHTEELSSTLQPWMRIWKYKVWIHTGATIESKRSQDNRPQTHKIHYSMGLQTSLLILYETYFLYTENYWHNDKHLKALRTYNVTSRHFTQIYTKKLIIC
jgi:hypothetical protein